MHTRCHILDFQFENNQPSFNLSIYDYLALETVTASRYWGWRSSWRSVCWTDASGQVQRSPSPWHWPRIGQDRSRDLNTGLGLAQSSRGRGLWPRRSSPASPGGSYPGSGDLQSAVILRASQKCRKCQPINCCDVRLNENKMSGIARMTRFLRKVLVSRCWTGRRWWSRRLLRLYPPRPHPRPLSSLSSVVGRYTGLHWRPQDCPDLAGAPRSRRSLWGSRPLTSGGWPRSRSSDFSSLTWPSGPILPGLGLCPAH